MTTVAIHQPQYLPWLPYLRKIASADRFVFLDNVQFHKGGVQNRNRIKGADGPLWLTVPVSASLEDRIADVRIANPRWSRKHARTVRQCYARAAHADVFERVLEPVYARGHARLADLNIEIIEALLDYLDIETRIVRASSLGVGGTGEELVINLCEALGATTYLSGPGAMAYQRGASFERRGIELKYHESTTAESYRQCHMKNGFDADLSALDSILNLGEGARALVGSRP